MDDDLTLRLSRAEALVLFDFLSRSDDATTTDPDWQ
jgi:hypothetical protein